jgi:glycosyltransferase involved in cell wall biosynthesis
MLQFSVITPVSRQLGILKEYLDSFLPLPQDTFEIILVGDVKVTDVPHPLDIKFIPQRHPSQSLRRNIGVAHAATNLLCFLDDDVQVNKLWFETLINWFSSTIHSRDILGGPSVDERTGFRIQLASAIESDFLTEGLIKRRSQLFTQVGIHGLPLCNMVCRRDVFNHIGGFNENISVYLDDVEFNYIARKLGYRFIFHKDMQVQHRIRPAWLPYLRYKWETRYEIGKIIPLYYCLYQDTFQLKLILASYIGLPLMLIFFPGHAWFVLLCLYLFFAFVSALKHIKSVIVFFLLPFGLLLTHIMIYSGFTCGLICGILMFPQSQKLIKQKNDRFRKFRQA